MSAKRVFYVFKKWSDNIDDAVFILQNPSIELLQKLKYERGLYIIPASNNEYFNN